MSWPSSSSQNISLWTKVTNRQMPYSHCDWHHVNTNILISPEKPSYHQAVPHTVFKSVNRMTGSSSDLISPNTEPALMVTNTVCRSGPPTTWTSPCLMMYISLPISPCNTHRPGQYRLLLQRSFIGLTAQTGVSSPFYRQSLRAGRPQIWASSACRTPSACRSPERRRNRHLNLDSPLLKENNIRFLKMVIQPH